MSLLRYVTFLKLLPSVVVAFVICASTGHARHAELPNRIPEAPPYNTAEAEVHPPPYEDKWLGVNNPAVCAGCHTQIFKDWNGSMMSNSWRDPAWRGAFLLLARMTSTNGNCDLPNPPDGTPKAKLNPFANSDCSSTFNLGTTTQTTNGSGSLLDDFCGRCHMPTNYVDQVRLANVHRDAPSGLEHGPVQSKFNPTSDNGTGIAFATSEGLLRNTASGKSGIACAVCHAYTESRYTPYHNYQKSGTEYFPALGTLGREALLEPARRDMLRVPDATQPNLGWAVGAGSYRLSPHAISTPERFGPLTHDDYRSTRDSYVSDVFKTDVPHQQGNFAVHKGYYDVMFERSEMCSACHDVTNPITIKNRLQKWVGGFPIERTYSEWASSRYADRPGNPNFDPNFKRDCQTCHMQQNYGQPATANTLYRGGAPVAPLAGKVWIGGTDRPAVYSHHFIGGNSYITRLVGADVDSEGKVAEYPKLSAYSFSSASETSPYHNAYWLTSEGGPATQHARLAWDRLRNVVTLVLSGPTSADAGTSQPLSLSVSNTGSGHKFPTGFPEGRNAWVALRAFDLATGTELEIHDTAWNRRSVGVGYLTQTDMVDPNFEMLGRVQSDHRRWVWVFRAFVVVVALVLGLARFMSIYPWLRSWWIRHPMKTAVGATVGLGCLAAAVLNAGSSQLPAGCNWHIPAGSPDPYAWQFKAVASLGDGCPTLDLPYATPLNMVVNAAGMPIDAEGKVIDRTNPLGRPQYRDLDGDGDPYNDAFLIDRRLQPLPHPGATVHLDRYAVVIPSGTVGPVAVTAAVYYQSLEAMVAMKLLGNLADTNLDFVLEPCVLKGPCDGRRPTVEPAVVEGAPPVPMAVKNWVIPVTGKPDTTPPSATTYPEAGATSVYEDVVVKVFFSEPVTGVDATTFTLTDAAGVKVPASIDQIGDFTWGLFPHEVFLKKGETYTARVASSVRDFANNPMTREVTWRFTISTTSTGGRGDTSIPLGGGIPTPAR